ncbi:MAG: hypothetical protein Q8P22_07970 [Chloroflexota bacterium]|nr:hypothetical protein [Chloroflexota bacterium]
MAIEAPTGGGVSARREGLSMEQAEGVARLLDGRCLDVRDAVRVGGLAPRMGVVRTLDLPGLGPSSRAT